MKTNVCKILIGTSFLASSLALFGGCGKKHSSSNNNTPYAGIGSFSTYSAGINFNVILDSCVSGHRIECSFTYNAFDPSRPYNGGAGSGGASILCAYNYPIISDSVMACSPGYVFTLKTQCIDTNTNESLIALNENNFYAYCP